MSGPSHSLRTARSLGRHQPLVQWPYVPLRATPDDITFAALTPMVSRRRQTTRRTQWLLELPNGTVHWTRCATLTAASAGCGCGSTFTVLLPAVPRLAAGEMVPRTSVGVSTDGPHSEGRVSALNTTNVQLSHCGANPIACADRTVGTVIRGSRSISEAL